MWRAAFNFRWMKVKKKNHKLLSEVISQMCGKLHDTVLFSHLVCVSIDFLGDQKTTCMAVFGNSEVSYFSELGNFPWSIKILSCRLVDTVQFLSDWNTWAKLVASSYTITQDALLLSKCLLEVILVFLNFIMWISKGTFSTSEVRMQFPNAAYLLQLRPAWMVFKSPEQSL